MERKGEKPEFLKKTLEEDSEEIIKQMLARLDEQEPLRKSRGGENKNSSERGGR